MVNQLHPLVVSCLFFAGGINIESGHRMLSLICIESAMRSRLCGWLTGRMVGQIANSKSAVHDTSAEYKHFAPYIMYFSVIVKFFYRAVYLYWLL